MRHLFSSIHPSSTIYIVLFFVQAPGAVFGKLACIHPLQYNSPLAFILLCIILSSSLAKRTPTLMFKKHSILLSNNIEAKS